MLPTSVPETLALLDGTLLFLIEVLLARHPDSFAPDNDDTHLPEFPLRGPPGPATDEDEAFTYDYIRALPSYLQTGPGY